MNLEMAGTSGVIDYDSAKNSPFSSKRGAVPLPSPVLSCRKARLNGVPTTGNWSTSCRVSVTATSRSSRQKTHTKRFVSRLPPLPPWPPASRWLSRMMRSHSPQHEKKAIDVFSKSDRMRGSFSYGIRRIQLCWLSFLIFVEGESYEIGSNQLCAYARVQLCQSGAGIEGVELVGIADPVEERGRKYAEYFGTAYYQDYHELLSQRLDGVIVTSENAHHKEHVLAAAATGVHVLCENRFRPIYRMHRI